MTWHVMSWHDMTWHYIKYIYIYYVYQGLGLSGVPTFSPVLALALAVIAAVTAGIVALRLAETSELA